MFKVTIQDLSTGETSEQTALIDVAVAGNIDTPTGSNPWWLAHWLDAAMLLGPIAALNQAVQLGAIEHCIGLAVAGGADRHGKITRKLKIGAEEEGSSDDGDRHGSPRSCVACREPAVGFCYSCRIPLCDEDTVCNQEGTRAFCLPCAKGQSDAVPA